MKRTTFVVMALLSMASVLNAQDQQTVVLTMDDAIRIALSESETIKVADLEVKKAGYAKKGSYASLYPKIDLSGSYQRAIKKQVMYISAEQGLEIGRDNTFNGAASASMPLVNLQLWQGIKISGQAVELAVEKARGSRLEMVSQVKQTFFAALLAKESFKVYKSVYENALENCELTQKKYNAQKASELDLTRAKTSLANAIPNVFDAESAVTLTLWQLKAVMGMNLDEEIDVAGSIADYASLLSEGLIQESNTGVEWNSSLRQLSLQAEQLAQAVKMNKMASVPSLSASFNYAMNGVANDLVEYRWTPYSTIGFSIVIPIFAGGKRLFDTKQSQVQYQEVLLQTEQLERQIRVSIRQYLNMMDTALRTYEAANDALGTAEKAYEIAQKSYSVGRSTLTDLNSSLLAKTQAQLNVYQSIYSFVVAKTNLEQTIGTDYSVQ